MCTLSLAHGTARPSGWQHDRARILRHTATHVQWTVCNDQVRIMTICRRVSDINWYPCSKICAGYQAVLTIGLFMQTWPMYICCACLLSPLHGNLCVLPALCFVVKTSLVGTQGGWHYDVWTLHCARATHVFVQTLCFTCVHLPWRTNFRLPTNFFQNLIPVNTNISCLSSPQNAPS